MRNLQQQKLLRHYSLNLQKIDVAKSTIVEITQALQPLAGFTGGSQIYNSRNYLGIIALSSPSQSLTLSTIVEITQALQPYQRIGICKDLQQQKLLRHYSPCCEHYTRLIYNSRNYLGIIAHCVRKVCPKLSTIVEITQALQPSKEPSQRAPIYNSRNYLGIIAAYLFVPRKFRSTIVEITQALQPYNAVLPSYNNLQQQKLLRHYSLKHRNEHR